MSQLFFALYTSEPSLDTAAMARALEVRHRGHRFAAERTDSGVHGITVNGISILIAPMAAPFPRGDIESVAPIARRGWHETNDDPAENRFHAIVTAVGGEPKRVALALTLVAGELCRADNCIGVLWGSSEVLAHRTIVCEAAGSASLENPAISLWVSAMPYQGDDGLGLTTRGLSIFAERELHFLPHASHELGTLFGRAIDFSGYLFANGPVVKDGQSLGYSAKDVLRARWVAGMDGAPNWIELRVESQKA